MYSFNLDYIFNVFYNILLAIRYVFLFWILRIDKAEYLADHRFDAWDGLRDRGWIRTPDNFSGSIFDPNAGTFYLGSSGEKDLSWWEIIKSKIFGWGNSDIGSISTSGKDGYSFNPGDVNFAIDKVGNSPWFEKIKWSIQNPILAFFADILSILTFIVMLMLIYSMLRWLALVIAPISEAKEKKRQEKILREKERREARLEKLKVEESFLEKEAEKREQRIENTLPAGIAGLPIDERDLTKEEMENIEEKRDILINYKAKNTLPLKPVNANNRIFNIQKYREEIAFKKEAEPHITQEKKEELALRDDRKEWYMERWNTVIGYMQGNEEAIWRIGILEADNLLDELLIDRGYQGLTMADRLKVASFNTIDLAWAAHKVRNRIAHEGSKFILTDRIARNTLELYRAIFKEFKIFE